MAKINEVLNLLIPHGGYIATGEDYEGIEFLECEPITKAQFEAGFAKADKYKIDQAKEKETAKAALIAKLGITAEEAALLLL